MTPIAGSVRSKHEVDLDGRPEVAVLAGRGETEAIRGLALALARRVRLVPAARAVAPVAVLITSEEVRTRADAVAWPWWPTAPERIGMVVGDAVRLGGHEIALPARNGVDTAARPPLAPLVRRRWRERLGLPADLVVRTAGLAADDVPTALALASTAVVEAEHLPAALALGCPLVATAEDAASVGAVDGEHLVVADHSSAEDSARLLAADEVRCARLSRAGRELAVRSLDPDRAASQILESWGIGEAIGMAAVADRYLAELGTNPTGPIRRRVADAVSIFSSGPEGPAEP